MKKRISERLQKARKSINLNQNQVADAIGISRGKLINIEKGEVSVDIILLGKLAHLYGYSLNYFIDDVTLDSEEVNFAFRAHDLTEEDSYIPSWGRTILCNIKDLEQICEEADL